MRLFKKVKKNTKVSSIREMTDKVEVQKKRMKTQGLNLNQAVECGIVDIEDYIASMGCLISLVYSSVITQFGHTLDYQRYDRFSTTGLGSKEGVIEEAEYNTANRKLLCSFSSSWIAYYYLFVSDYKMLQESEIRNDLNPYKIYNIWLNDPRYNNIVERRYDNDICIHKYNDCCYPRFLGITKEQYVHPSEEDFNALLSLMDNFLYIFDVSNPEQVLEYPIFYDDEFYPLDKYGNIVDVWNGTLDLEKDHAFSDEATKEKYRHKKVIRYIDAIRVTDDSC